jgi:cell division protein FtsL
MGALFAVIAVLAVLVLLLTWALTQLQSRYDQLTGRPPAARQTAPWLRSMRAEREADVRRKYGISGIEKAVVAAVVVAVLAFEIWFFFFAGSSLPNS